MRRRGRVHHHLGLREARSRLVLTQLVDDLHHLRSGRDVIRVDLLQAVDVLEDAAQLFGVAPPLSGLAAKARQDGPIAHVLAG